jgi:hypothetical protein
VLYGPQALNLLIDCENFAMQCNAMVYGQINFLIKVKKAAACTLKAIGISHFLND